MAPASSAASHCSTGSLQGCFLSCYADSAKTPVRRDRFGVGAATMMYHMVPSFYPTTDGLL